MVQILSSTKEGQFEVNMDPRCLDVTRKKFARSLAQNPTPDGNGYYGFSKEHNASIRVLSYRKVFRDAELRHRAFFDQLGLLPEEVRRSLASAASKVMSVDAVAAAE